MGVMRRGRRWIRKSTLKIDIFGTIRYGILKNSGITSVGALTDKKIGFVSTNPNLEETKAKIASLEYIQNELAGIPNLV